MTVYKESPKESTKQVLELVSDFSKVAGYMVNIHKPILFLYTSSKQLGNLKTSL